MNRFSKRFRQLLERIILFAIFGLLVVEFVFVVSARPTSADDVGNTKPEITEVVGSLEPVAVNEETVIAVSFYDPDEGDSFKATIDWGDGTSHLYDIGYTTSFTDPEVYQAAGIYEVSVTISDAAGAESDPVSFQFITVYDPNDGFVTGGGWIDSPADAYKPDPALTGKATFGFVSKYKKGASVPAGNTQFQFKAGGMNFSSSSYDWLVVTGDDSTARFKGTGTINGEIAPNGQSYKFMIWATDGQPDSFRIKIWYEDEGGEILVYDNGFIQALGGGSIAIHKGK
jgi:WD40 repeat protein